MRMLVMGGTGLLGPFVVRQLVDMGHDVNIFHTGEHEADLPSQVRHVHSSLARLPISGIPAELKDPPPDVVILMHPNGQEDTELVMREFSGIARRVVAVSSMDVYRAFARTNGIDPGLPDPLPLTEDSPLRDNLYPYRGETLRAAGDPRKAFDTYDKILVERAVLSDPALPGTALRMPMIYGPGDRQNRLYSYLKPMDDGRPVIPIDEGLAAWRAPRGYVENVAWAVTLAATKDRAAGRIYNVGEPESSSVADFVRRIAEATGWQGEIVLLPAGLTEMPLDTTQHWVVDTRRIRQELGYSEIVLPSEGIRRAVEWERANPPAPDLVQLPDYEEEDLLLAGLQSTG